MPDFKITAQMYTLRDACTDEASVAEACRRVKEMGYEAIQPSAAYFNAIEPEVLRQILDDNNLLCGPTHRGLEAVEDTEACAAEHKTLGTDLVAIGGWFDRDAEWTREAWTEFARRFDRAANNLAEQGMRLGYHNHNHEFACLAADPADFDPENVPLAVLAEECGENVWFEVDTYWVQIGGGDPAAWIRRLAGRVPGVHLKDFAVSREREPLMCEVGHGNLNWDEILAACEEADVEYLMVERDRGELDAFKSLEISARNLRKMVGK